MRPSLSLPSLSLSLSLSLSPGVPGVMSLSWEASVLNTYKLVNSRHCLFYADGRKRREWKRDKRRQLAKLQPCTRNVYINYFLRVSRVRLDREAIGQRGKHRLPFVHTALENLSKWRLGEPINPRLRYDDSMRIYFTKERTHGWTRLIATLHGFRLFTSYTVVYYRLGYVR